MTIAADSYPYKGMPLTPTVVLELVEGFLDGPRSRPEIIRRLTEIHRDGGGLFISDGHLLSSVKKGLGTGVERGRLTRPRSGWYAKNEGRDSALETPSAETPTVEGKDLPTGDRVFDVVAGDGTGEVYVWFYDAYQQLAQHKGEQHWPCKVGRSEAGAGMRIREQTGYAPEQPHYALLIHTNQAQQLEAHLHGFLASRGRRLLNAIGSEWFNTNPEEVLALAVATIWVTSPDAHAAA